MLEIPFFLATASADTGTVLGPPPASLLARPPPAPARPDMTAIRSGKPTALPTDGERRSEAKGTSIERMERGYREEREERREREEREMRER